MALGLGLASRVFQCVWFGYFFLTTACLTITTSSPFDDGSFEKDSTANLTCTHTSYTGIQQWNFSTFKVLDCGFLSCVETPSDPERFSFDNDRSNGIFIFTISPVQLSDEGTIIKCYDGNDEEQFTVKVRESETTASTSKKARNIGLGVGLGVGLALLTIFVVVACCVKQRCPCGESIDVQENCVIETSNITYASVTLSWRYRKIPITAYIVEYKKHIEPNYLRKIQVQTGRPVILKNLEESTWYEAKVDAVSRQSEFSQRIYFQTEERHRVPEEFHYSRITDSSVTLSWKVRSSESPISAYIVEYKSNFESEYSTRKIPVDTALFDGKYISHNLDNLKEGTHYEARVKVESEGRQSEFTKKIHFETEERHVVPERFPYSNITDSSVTLSWKGGYSESPITAYIVEYKAHNESKYMTHNIPVDTAMSNDEYISHSINNLNKRTKYEARVKAESEDRHSEKYTSKQKILENSIIMEITLQSLEAV